MKKLILSLFAMTLMFLAPDLAKAERFEAIPAAITDTVTGLMWLSQPCCIHGSWEESDAFTAELDYAGYQDWRTPTVEELEALFEAIGSPSDFPTQTDNPLFNDMQRYYWTITPFMVFDISDSTIFYDEVNPYWIWPVRTAFIPTPEPQFPDDIQAPTGTVDAYDNIPTTTDQPIASGYYNGSSKAEGASDLVAGNIRSPLKPFFNPRARYGGCKCTRPRHSVRWCDNGDGTVTDLFTCLVWLKKADWGGKKQWRNNSADCGSLKGTCYDDAHTRASTLKAGTPGAALSDGSVEGDWRLPTKTELFGLTQGAAPVHDYLPQSFTGVTQYYWTSTTWPAYVSFALGVDMHNSVLPSHEAKAAELSVWPVRSGKRSRMW